MPVSHAPGIAAQVMSASVLPVADPAAPRPLRLVVLAGQRRGGIDPLAARFGQSHRSLIPLAGRPLIAHVLQVAAAHPAVASLAVSIEREAFDPVWDVLTRLPGRGNVALVEAQADIAGSVRAAMQGWDGPLVVTTADHALLTAQSIDAMADGLLHADAAFALAPRASVEAVHHGARQPFAAFADGAMVPCDIYGISGADAIRAVEVFRGNGGYDRSASRLARALGPVGLLLLGCRLLTLDDAIARVSRRLRLRLGAVVLDDGTQALDVDDDRTYAVARDLLERRALPSPGSVATDTPHRAVA